MPACNAGGGCSCRVVARLLAAEHRRRMRLVHPRFQSVCLSLTLFGLHPGCHALLSPLLHSAPCRLVPRARARRLAALRGRDAASAVCGASAQAKYEFGRVSRDGCATGLWFGVWGLGFESQFDACTRSTPALLPDGAREPKRLKSTSKPPKAWRRSCASPRPASPNRLRTCPAPSPTALL